MTQEAHGTKLGRSSRTAETSVARTARTAMQRTQPLRVAPGRAVPEVT